MNRGKGRTTGPDTGTYFFFLGDASEEEFFFLPPLLEYLFLPVSTAVSPGEIPNFLRFLSRLYSVALRATLGFVHFSISCGYSVSFCLHTSF